MLYLNNETYFKDEFNEKLKAMKVKHMSFFLSFLVNEINEKMCLSNIILIESLNATFCEIHFKIKLIC